MKITLEIPDKRLQNLLSCAFEGGSSYWAIVIDRSDPAPASPYLFQRPFDPEGFVILGDRQERKKNPDGKLECPTYRLDLQAVEKGLHLFATSQKYARHFAQFMLENEDAITGDVFLQLCTLGEVLYG